MSGMHVFCNNARMGSRAAFARPSASTNSLVLEAPPIPVGLHLDRYSFRIEEACGHICPVSDGEEIAHRHNKYEIYMHEVLVIIRLTDMQRRK